MSNFSSPRDDAPSRPTTDSLPIRQIRTQGNRKPRLPEGMHRWQAGPATPEGSSGPPMKLLREWDWPGPEYPLWVRFHSSREVFLMLNFGIHSMQPEKLLHTTLKKNGPEGECGSMLVRALVH